MWSKSDHLSFEHHNTTDTGVLINFNNAIGPLRIQGLEILSATLDDELFEGGFFTLFQHHHHIPATDRFDMRIDEDQVTIVEAGFHADPVHTQDKGVLTACDRAGQ